MIYNSCFGDLLLGYKAISAMKSLLTFVDLDTGCVQLAIKSPSNPLSSFGVYPNRDKKYRIVFVVTIWRVRLIIFDIRIVAIVLICSKANCSWLCYANLNIFFSFSISWWHKKTKQFFSFYLESKYWNHAFIFYINSTVAWTQICHF